MRIDLQNAILLVLCLVLLLSVFTLSANAASFLPMSTTSSSPTFLFQIDSSSESFYAYTESSVPIYIGYIQSEPRFVYFACETNAEYHYSTSQYLSGIHRVDNRSGDLYYSRLGAASGTVSPNAEIPQYATLADFLNAVIVGEVTTSPLEYSLPPGNVAYIPIPSGQSSAITYTLTTTYYMAFGNNDTSRINQVVTVMSSLPSSTNNTAPSAPKIPWTNNGNVNLLGVSANKIYQGSIPANYGGQYLVVVNPMTMPSQTGLIGGDTYTNGSINISVSAVSGSPHIYPMSESLTITPGDGIGSESSYGDSGYTYEIDPETGEIIWTDPEGGSSAPVAGGNNPMPSPNTIFDWLRNISQQFSDFLRGPVQAVQVVVSAIRDFLGSFTQLYQWLPSPVYSLITSALMIALTIGVIKIFV